MQKTMIRLIICIFVSMLCITSHAFDYEREKRLEAEIIDGIFDGDPIQLKSGSLDFLAIDMESQIDETQGAAIVIHTRGLHPDWDGVTKPLRIHLAEQGWRTVSLQMPVLDKGELY